MQQLVVGELLDVAQPVDLAVASSIDVRVEPGETAQAVTPVPTRSAASPFTIPTTACLAAL